MPFDLSGTRAALGQLIQQRRLEQSPAYQAQVQGQVAANEQAAFNLAAAREQKARFDAFVQQIGETENINATIKAGLLNNPETAIPYLTQRERENRLADLARLGDWNTFAVMTGQAPTEMKVAETTAIGQAQEPLAKRQQERETAGRIAEINAEYAQRRKLEKEKEKQTTMQPFDKKQLDLAATQIAKLENVPVILGSLAEQWRALKAGEKETGVRAKLEAWGKKIAGQAGVEEYAGYSAYDATQLGISKQVSRSLGDVGNIAVQEQEINARMLPKSTDTKVQGEEKIQNMSELVNAIVNAEYGRVEEIFDKYGVSYTHKSNTPEDLFNQPDQTGFNENRMKDIQAGLNKPLQKVAPSIQTKTSQISQDQDTYLKGLGLQ